MAELEMLDRAYYTIMQYFIKTGHAPHYTELANNLGLEMEEGRQLIHDLMKAGVPGWIHPQTDWIASFPPFNNQPTQYYMSVEGEQKWYAQGGFEALAVRWLFPGKLVRMDANCLDCGKPMIIEMRDEQVLTLEPDTMVGYAYSQVGGDLETRPYRGAGMNLFRSEEHVRNWSYYNPEFDKNLQPISYYLERFSGVRARYRGRPDYMSWLETDEAKNARKATLAKHEKLGRPNGLELGR